MSVLSPPPLTPPSPDELEALIREARARQRRRWLIAAAVLATVAGAAVAIYSLESATGKRPVTGGTAGSGVAPRCTLSELRVHRIGSYAGLGQSGGYYGFTNMGHHACSISGWPYVVAVKADGQTGTGQRVRQTFYGPFKAPRRPPTVDLKPGTTAAFALTTSDSPPGNARTCPAPYTKLRIGLAKGSATATLSAWIPYLGNYLQACIPRPAVSEIVPRSDLRG